MARVPDPAVPEFGAEWDAAWEKNLLAKAMERVRDPQQGALALTPLCTLPANLVAAWSFADQSLFLAADALGNNPMLGDSSIIDGVTGLGRRMTNPSGLQADGQGPLNLTGSQITLEAWLRLELNPDTRNAFTGAIGKNQFPDGQPHLIVFENGPNVGLPGNEWLFEYILTSADGNRHHNQGTGVRLTADGMFHHAAGGTRITWTALPQQSFFLEESADLQHWIPLNIAVTESAAGHYEATLAGGTTGSHFYRARIRP